MRAAASSWNSRITASLVSTSMSSSRAISAVSASTSGSRSDLRICADCSLPTCTSSTAALRRPVSWSMSVMSRPPFHEPAAQQLGDLVGLVLDELADLLAAHGAGLRLRGDRQRGQRRQGARPRVERQGLRAAQRRARVTDRLELAEVDRGALDPTASAGEDEQRHAEEQDQAGRLADVEQVVGALVRRRLLQVLLG